MLYCKKMDAYLVGRMNRVKPATFAQIENIWYEGYRESRSEHYHNNRYHFLYLHSFFQGHRTVGITVLSPVLSKPMEIEPTNYEKPHKFISSASMRLALFVTLMWKSFVWINHSCLHFGQYRGKFINSVSDLSFTAANWAAYPFNLLHNSL